MELPTIEKGDTIATKDGRSIRVLSVYKPAGTILRVEGIDESNPSPMREPVFAKDIARILRKGDKKAGQPAVKIPDGQIVKDKDPVDPKLEKDIESRDVPKSTSAETKAKAGQVRR